MVPLQEYATVPEDASLLDAVFALEKARDKSDDCRYRHQAILVVNESGMVIGKLSQLNILKALEPRYQALESHEGMTHYGFSQNFIELTLEENSLWDIPLEQICQKVILRKVNEFMRTPTEEECVTEDTSLDAAIHQLIIGKHQSLLVTQDGVITGVLRLTDVFSGIFQIIGECKE